MAKPLIGDLYIAVARDVGVPLAITVLQYLHFTSQMGTAHCLCGDGRSLVTPQSLTRINVGSMMEQRWPFTGPSVRVVCPSRGCADHRSGRRRRGCSG